MAMKMIRVPKTPKKAFNPNRKASGLLQAQVEHLELAAGVAHPADTRAPAKAKGRAKAPRRKVVRTEKQAAEYIQSLTSQLNADAAHEVALEAPARRAKKKKKTEKKKAPRRRVGRKKR